jgi:flagellar biosynthesis protein FlhG
MGGTGGVGSSTVAWCIARELVRREKSVLLVDLDLHAPTHLLRFDETPARPLETVRLDESDGDWREAVRRGGRRYPDLLTAATARVEPLLKPGWRASQITALFRATNYDFVVLDLPSHATAFHSSAFALSDYPVLVTTTEPEAVVGATHALRSALVYGMLHHPRAGEWERSLVEMAEALPWDLDRSTVEHMLRERNLPYELYGDTIHRFRSSLVLNQIRDHAEGELAEPLALSWGFLFGSRPQVLAKLRYDEQRWFYQRSHEQPDYELGEDSQGTIRSLAARILTSNGQTPFVDGHFDSSRGGLHLLGLNKEADAATARARYRTLWEGFRRQSALTRFIVDSHLREDILARLEQANREVIRHLPTLGAEDKKQEEAGPSRKQPESRPAERLEDARRAAGMSRRELSLRTRVGLRYVEAICEYRTDEFPREVYLRGYLVELARAVGLDQEEFVTDYIAAVHDQRQRDRLK